MSLTTDSFQFLTLNKQADWEKGLSQRIQITGQGLQIAETVKYVFAGQFGSEFMPRGAFGPFAVDRCGLIYLIDDQGAVWLGDPGQKRFSRLCCLGAYVTGPLCIAVTPHTLYIADSNGRLSAFALINWQLRWQRGLVDCPVDGAGVSPDKSLAEGPARTVGSRDKSVAGSTVMSQEMTPGVSPDTNPDPSIPESGDRQTLELAVAPGGNVFVLLAGRQKVWEVSPGGERLREILISGLDRDLTGLAVSPEGCLFVFDRLGKQLLRIDLTTGEQNDTFVGFAQPFTGLAVDSKGELFLGSDNTITKYDRTGKVLGELAYREAVGRMAIDDCDRLYIVRASSVSGEAPVLAVLEPRPVLTRLNQAALPSGIYYSPAFDSVRPGMTWHKAVLEAEIPENTQIKVAYRIAEYDDLAAYYPAPGDSPADLENKAAFLAAVKWSTPLTNPRDALIFDPENDPGNKAAGRYFWLKIELIGTELQSPTLESVRVYLPRQSYLRYLPAVYQEDSHSRAFLERFLALFETCFTTLEGEIDRVSRLFDPGSVPVEFMDDLAAWLGIAADENWPEAKRRQLIKQAVSLYKKRGTCAGIAEIIELFTGTAPLLLENYAGPHRFAVLLNPVSATNGNFTVQEFSSAQLSTVGRLINSEKPAHTEAELVVLQPWIYLDLHTYLGVNSCLSEPCPRLDSGAYLPRDTVLTDFEAAGQVERKARLGLDTRLT